MKFKYKLIEINLRFFIFQTKLEVVPLELVHESNHKLILITISLCGLILALLVSGGLIYLFKRNAIFREKIQGLTNQQPDAEATKDYQVKLL